MSKTAPTNSESPQESGWDRRKREKTQQIVNAATDLFLAEGFAGVSMDNVVETSGISKRTLYNYYESKEHLFIDVIQTQLENFWPVLERTAEHGEDPAKHMHTLAVEILSMAMTPTPLALYRIAIAESQRFPELAQRFYDFSSQQMINRLRDMLKQFEDRPDLVIAETRLAAEQFLDLLIGTAFMRIVLGIDPPMSAQKIREHADRVVGAFVKAYST